MSHTAKKVPGPVVISAREYVEAMERLERSKVRLIEAENALEASEQIVSGCRPRFLGVIEAYAVDDSGDPPLLARSIWPAALGGKEKP